MYRVEVIREEMASAVRILGGEGSAKKQVTTAARATGLTASTVERLRWKKIKRIPADIADAIREALEHYEKETVRRVEHKLMLAEQKNKALMEEIAQYRASGDRL